MKKILITALALASSPVLAKNASFLREPAQSAVVTDASTALYNPAGSVYLAPGFYASFSSLSVLREWDIETTEKTTVEKFLFQWCQNLMLYGQKKNLASLLTSTLMVVVLLLKTDYLHNQIMETSLKAGLSLQHKGAKFSDPSNVIDASERLYFVNLGSAYKINDKFSFAAGAKAVSGEKNFDAELRYNSIKSDEDIDGVYKLHFEEKAIGVAPFLAAHARLQVTGLFLQYDFKVKMPYKVKVFEDDLSPISEAANKEAVAVEGAIENNDIPAALTLATKYQATNRLRMGLTYSRTYFEGARQDTWQKSMKLKREAYNNPDIKGKPLSNRTLLLLLLLIL